LNKQLRQIGISSVTVLFRDQGNKMKTAPTRRRRTGVYAAE